MRIFGYIPVVRATAAANAGFPDCLFKKHGRWKSLLKNDYIEGSLGSFQEDWPLKPLYLCSLNIYAVVFGFNL